MTKIEGPYFNSYILLVVLILLLSSFPLSANAQDSTVLAQAKKTESPYFSGDWNGSRNKLEDHGLVIKPRLTFWGQGFVAGKGEKIFRTSGKADLLLNYNGAKLGLKRWSLVMHFDYNFGKTVNERGGSLIPVNTAPLFPGLAGSKAYDLSSFHLSYVFGKKNNVLLFGKINMLDIGAAARFTGGGGIDAFWNTAFCAPVTGIIPPYLFGVLNVINTDFGRYTFMLFDPGSVVNKSGWEAPFKKGVSVSASIAKDFKIGGKQGTHSVRLAYSTQDGRDLYDLGDIFLPIPDTILGKKNVRYYISYSINQRLVTYDESGKGWGLVGLLGVSDGNPNPVDVGMHLGIGGNSFFKGRIDDKWGIAWYYYSLSKPIDELAKPVRPLGNETGIEAFYEFKLYRGWYGGADVQWIHPIVKEFPNALFLGLRTSVRI